jgi:hypothetical protein
VTEATALPRASRVEALRRLYAAAGGDPALFAFGTSEILTYLAAACAGTRSPSWPSGAGGMNRLLRPLARSGLARAAFRPALAVATAITSRSSTRGSGGGLPSASPGTGCRVVLGFPSANEERILAWRDASLPLPTRRLPEGPSAEPTPAAREPTAEDVSPGFAALRGSVDRVAGRLAKELSAPALPIAARLAFLRRVPGWLRTCRALTDVHARDPVREILATTLDERAFAAAHWARGRPSVEVHWVQHGFLALDLLPWIPGARHHAYDDAHPTLSATLGAPAADLAPPIGLSYFPRGGYEPTKTILVASQGLLPFALPIGRDVESAYAEVVRRALAGGWRVVQRPHRIETHEGFARHVLPGVEVADGAGTMEEQIRALRPRYVVSVWSTAALDAAALGARAVFVLSVDGMREHSLADLRTYGEVLDPADPTFSAKVDRMLSSAAAEPSERLRPASPREGA